MYYGEETNGSTRYTALPVELKEFNNCSDALDVFKKLDTLYREKETRIKRFRSLQSRQISQGIDESPLNLDVKLLGQVYRELEHEKQKMIMRKNTPAPREIEKQIKTRQDFIEWMLISLIYNKIKLNVHKLCCIEG